MFGFKNYLTFKSHFPNHWGVIGPLAVVGPTRNSLNNHSVDVIVFW